MNYIFFTPLLGFGGLEIQMAKRTLDAIKNNDNALLICPENSRLENYAKELNLPFDNLVINIKYFDFKAIIKLGKIMKQFEANICVVCQTQFLFIALLAKKIFNLKTKIILYQQLESGIKKKDPLHNYIYRSISGAVVLTKSMKKSLAKNTILKPEKISVIPYGIDTESYSSNNFIQRESRQFFILPENAFIIGNIGRIELLKGQLTLIEAFAEANIKNSFLVIAGNIGQDDYGEMIRKRVIELGIKDRFYLLPFTNETAKLMNSFDIFVLPSFSEAFGLVNIEAMSAGLPVVATNSGGVPEIIQHNINGLLFETRDSKMLSKLLIELFNNKNFREKLSSQAVLDANSRYNYNRQSKKFFEFCENI